ncbi:MAG: flagellar biosynthesis protein FlhF [Treponema sp.]|jgi:flagellar biosynthesis protein FlhF|nr:flagellar biosynthesis protein FlhF [Treponema sp.]
MEMYIEHGMSRRECELKIAEKYKRPFHILSEKEIRVGGFMGMFSKPGVQVEFYFAPLAARNPVFSGYPQRQFPEHRYTASDLEEEKRKVLAVAGKSYSDINASGREASQQILDSLNELKQKIETGGKKEEHPSFARAAELLRKNDFSHNYINGMLERLRKELSLEKLEDFDVVQNHLLEWIGESISIYKEETVTRKPRIMVLVGPTGVGKTTTISKLAAIYGIGTDEIPAVDVRMITIDAFRICAKEQLISIGNIMQIPVSCVVDKQALRKEIAVNSDMDLFLIDTIGKSPKDSSKLGEMKEILDGAGKGAEFHLVISASTKTSDIEDIMRQFEPFNYKSVVLTKMDETDRIGNIISALAEKRKSVSFITDGQTVPLDIRRASVVRFLINLDGFKVDREKIESRFPSWEAEQFRWR